MLWSLHLLLLNTTRYINLVKSLCALCYNTCMFASWNHCMPKLHWLACSSQTESHCRAWFHCAIPTTGQGADQAWWVMEVCYMWNNNINMRSSLCMMQAREGPIGGPGTSSSSYQTCSTQTHVMLSTSWLTTQRHAAGCSQRLPNCWQNRTLLQMLCCVML